jgi:hypothetical protein
MFDYFFKGADAGTMQLEYTDFNMQYILTAKHSE